MARAVGLSIILFPSSFDGLDGDWAVGIPVGSSSVVLPVVDDPGIIVVTVTTVLDPPGETTVLIIVLNMVLMGPGISGIGVVSGGSSVVTVGSTSAPVSVSVDSGMGIGTRSAVLSPCVDPGVNGCVSSMSRSSSFQRICNAGPTVQSAVLPVGPTTVYPHTPPRKSVVSEVQV